MIRTAFFFMLATTAAFAQEPQLRDDGLHMGFYCGLSTLFPYGAVYCPREDCRGDCRGVFMFVSESAPLPDSSKLCTYAEKIDRWYRWKPRIISDDQQKYLGRRVCFLADRGAPMSLSDLPREE